MLIIIIVLFTMVASVNLFTSNPLTGAAPKNLSYSEVSNYASEGKIKEAQYQGNELSGTLSTNEKFNSKVPDLQTPAGADFAKELRNSNVKLTTPGQSVGTTLLSILASILLPVAMMVALWMFFLRPMQSGGNQAMNFGRSRAKRVGENGPKVTFEDVAGIDEAKEELYEIVDYLRNTKRYAALGAKIPKGVLLTGEPGVGKTHLSRAIAGEAGVPFFHISGSDFVEMFVGVGAARVRDLFETAKAHRPSLIFIDEIDAVGRQRGAGLGGGHDEREQTLNQLLVEMDGFEANSGVVMIAATNRPDVLDPALLRPGRFDRQIVVDSPDMGGREAILKIHAKGKPLDSDTDLAVLARRTPGFTGADLANLLNEAALLTARRNKSRIGMAELNEALDRVIGGPERRSRVMNPKEREIIAYHEAGHAVIGELLPESDPVHKVTILPRGMSLGSTWHIPVEDKFLVSKEELLDDITSLLGGRVAEEVVYNKIYTGATSDLSRVSAIAKAMICRYGMSDKLGTLALGQDTSSPFLGRGYSQSRDYSEDIARQIDEEVHAIVDFCHQRATTILTERRETLDKLVEALLERETLTREEFLLIMEGKELPPFEKQTLPPSGDATENDKKNKPVVAPPRLEPGPA